MAKRYRDVVGDGGSDILGQITDQKNHMSQRMSAVKHKIAIMSGKGGVGKSTMTVNLAASLCRQGLRVGVVDADVYGPSLAQMLGLRRHRLDFRAGGAEPAVSEMGIKLISMDFFLSEDRTPVVWNGPQQDAFSWKGMMEMHALREFLADTAWGELDYLLVDLPPGTNQLATLIGLMPGLDGCVVVSVPSRVTSLVVNRSINMAARVLHGRVFGVVENMSGYYCTDCDKERPLFGQSREGAYGDLPILARIPFDPRMAEACDLGTPFVKNYEDSPAAKVFHELAERVNGLVVGAKEEIQL